MIKKLYIYIHIFMYIYIYVYTEFTCTGRCDCSYVPHREKYIYTHGGCYGHISAYINPTAIKSPTFTCSFHFLGPFIHSPHYLTLACPQRETNQILLVYRYTAYPMKPFGPGLSGKTQELSLWCAEECACTVAAFWWPAHSGARTPE